MKIVAQTAAKQQASCLRYRRCGKCNRCRRRAHSKLSREYAAAWEAIHSGEGKRAVLATLSYQADARVKPAAQLRKLERDWRALKKRWERWTGKPMPAHCWAKQWTALNTVHAHVLIAVDVRTAGRLGRLGDWLRTAWAEIAGGGVHIQTQRSVHKTIRYILRDTRQPQSEVAPQ